MIYCHFIFKLIFNKQIQKLFKIKKTSYFEQLLNKNNGLTFSECKIVSTFEKEFSQKSLPNKSQFCLYTRHVQRKILF